MLEWYHLLAVNQGLAAGAPTEAAIEHLRLLTQTKDSAILQEKLGQLLMTSAQGAAASAAYAAALKLSKSPKQKQRLAAEQALLQAK